jgi:hypothetical protein
MKKFIKITTRDGDSIIRSWIDIDSIDYLKQNSAEEGRNEGACRFIDGTVIPIIAYNETIDSLNK